MPYASEEATEVPAQHCVLEALEIFQIAGLESGEIEAIPYRRGRSILQGALSLRHL